MRILLVGATGFIARALAPALERAGHAVVRLSRHGDPDGRPSVALDVASARRARDWLGALTGVDAVVYAVGTFQEQGEQTFQALHVDGPHALYEACVTQGVRRVVHLSPPGPHDGAASRYHLTKRASDRHLLGLPLRATVLQPSLVFGPDGASARLFCRWAALPLVPVPGRGAQRVQPVHLDDVVDAIVATVQDDTTAGHTLALVGPEPLTLADYLRRLRRGLGLAPAPVVPVPMALARAATRVASRLGDRLADPEALDMLARGNAAPDTGMRRLLGRPPRPVATFIGAPVDAWRVWAQAGWTLPMLRLAVAAVWLFTAVVSFGVFPVDQSRELLARVGAEGGFATLLLYGAAGTDLALGLAVLCLPHRRWVWVAQLLLIAGYTALITWRLPEFWWHPFGPILKNLPMLAAIALLAALEAPRRWTT